MAAPTRRDVLGPNPIQGAFVRAALVMRALSLREEGKTLDEALESSQMWLPFDRYIVEDIIDAWKEADEEAARKIKPSRAE